MRHSLVVAAVLGAWLLATAGPAVAQIAQVLLRTDTDRAAADGQSVVVVTVEVRDVLGQPAPDGTRVSLVTSHGRITPFATTRLGVARADLVAPSYPATAVVSATVEGITDQVTVEFVALDFALPPAARLVVGLHGDRVAFSEQRAVVIAGPHARLEWEGFSIEADEIECHAGAGVVRATGPVTLRWADRERRGTGLIFYLVGGYGTLLDPGAPDGRVVLDRGLNERDDLPPDPVEDIGGFDTSGTVIWIEAKDAVLFVGERIHFRRPRFNIAGRRLWPLLYHVHFLERRDPGTLNQILSYDTARGLTLDFPLYLFAGTNAVTALHLRRIALFGFAPEFTTSGWSTGLEHQYRLPNGGIGGLWLEDVTGRRAFFWNHAQEFEHQTYGNFALTYDPGIEPLPDQGVVSASFNRRVGTTLLSFVGSGLKTGGGFTWNSDLTAESSARLLGGWLAAQWRLGLGVGPLIVAPGFFDDPDSPAEPALEQALHQTAALTLSPPRWNLASGLQLSAAVTGRLTHFESVGFRDEYSARVGLVLQRGDLARQRQLYASLGYRLSLTENLDEDRLTREGVNVVLRFQDGDRWEAQSFATYNLSRSDLFLSGWVSYRLPGKDGQPSRWRAFVQVSHSDFSSATFTDSRLAVGYRLGLYELLLNYSPNGGTGEGRGFSFGAGDNFWIELIAARL